MAYINWTDDLQVGVAEIDAQHQELFARVNSLLEACHQAKGREAVGEVIAFLGSYVVEHFNMEERFMISRKYVGYEEHRSEHQRFIQRFSELRARFEKEGPGVHIVIMTNQTVVNWLNSHIRTMDKRLGGLAPRS